MAKLPVRWRVALAGLAGWVFVAWALAPPIPQPVTLAQEKARPAGEKKLQKTYYGVSTCSGESCHGAREPLKQDPPLVCRCTEANIWKENDKHTEAYLVIDTDAPDNRKADRARQMEKVLGAGRPGYKVSKDEACLACHAVVRGAAVEDRSFKIQEGVNCVVCHGAYREWVKEHASPFAEDREKFRALSREVKQAEQGMTDLWDPAKRAQLCASCHIGNDEQKKVVTHAMYAAGHPPLPGFEVGTFSDEMPRHWEYLREKSKAVRRKQEYHEGEQEQTKLILVGAAVALRETMTLLRAQAKCCEQAKEEGGKVLDLSNFDCYSCHHELRSPSWRQSLRDSGRPGRVPMRQWPVELVRLAVEASGDGKTARQERARFDRLVQDVQRAFVVRPYGDPERIAASAQALAEWADGLAKKLNSKSVSVDRETARRLLKRIPALYQGGNPPDLDYDSARQVAWAGLTIYREVTGSKLIVEGNKVSYETPSAFRPLDDYLRLRLPRKPRLVTDELGANLKALNGYEPGQFQALLRGLKLPGL